MYEVIFSKRAKKMFCKLPLAARERLIGALERARIRPQAHFIPLVGLKGYKLRVGDYRIIADINQGRLEVLVFRVGHRRNICK